MNLDALTEAAQWTNNEWTATRQPQNVEKH